MHRTGVTVVGARRDIFTVPGRLNFGALHLFTDVRELVAVVLAVVVFGASWTGEHVVLSFFSDNDAVVHALSVGFARHDDRMNGLMRVLHLLQSQHHFAFAATHIAGVRNVGADALSRNNLRAFLSAVAPFRPVQVEPDLSTFHSLWLTCR